MSRSTFTCRILPIFLIALFFLSFSLQAQAAPQVIYGDGLAASWDNWSWATVNLAATSPTNNGSSNSISVTYGAWQGLYLHHPGLNTAGFTKLRFFVHGGSSGGQLLNVYAERAVGGQGPAVSVAAIAANTWTEVQIPLSSLAAANTTVTGFVWQDRSGGSQPTFYVDDIALIGDESLEGPVLSQGVLVRSAAPADGQSGVVVRVQVTDPQGAGDIASVTLNATALGRGNIPLYDNGRSNDGATGDGLYGAVFSVAPNIQQGEHNLLLTARDQAGHSANLQLGAFVVLNAPGGSIPPGLPQRPAWGTSLWSDTNPSHDWQANTGLAWDYLYQYITYDWYVNGWGGSFVGRFAKHAWDNGYIPVISVYLMLGVPDNCGESPTCYAQKLKNSITVNTYLAALQEAARQAKGSKPVIFHLEPDFYGYMQQLSNQNNRPAGVQPDNPASYPVALNIPGYPNNLTGFGRRMVDLIHQTAPNALVAPHASMWAIDKEPHTETVAGTLSMAQRTAAFMNAMGGSQADLFFVEWSDRDSGSGLRPWWDDTNRTLPHVNRAILWENALSAAAGRRLILWQVPAGNIALDNTDYRYQDNRPAYAFRHPRDLYEAGVIAVLFGAGMDKMTRPDTDGGFIRSQAAIAYANPATPTGLAAGAAMGPSVPLHWNENSHPDLWGYRLSYVPAGGGTPITVDVGPANAANLLLPSAGQWRIRIAAYDAMSRLSPFSNFVTVTTTADAAKVYLPMLRRN